VYTDEDDYTLKKMTQEMDDRWDDEYIISRM